MKFSPILAPLAETSRRFHAFVAILLALIAWGAYGYYIQLTEGLVATGMRNAVMWGLYITNFVFFIGISHAGTLISAILRVTHAEWRRPITRMAEAITVFALFVGATMPIVDLGRPDRMLNLVMHGRIESPILWDFISIGTYLTGSIIYLYLPLIPDIATCRDRVSTSSWMRRRIYSFFSMGWVGSAEQRRLLEKGIGIMALIIIPVAVSVHTVVSWIFGMTLRVGWHSTIFGPYFVVGAIFSGVASILIAMAVFRRVYHLEGYIKAMHFKNLGLMLLALDLAYLYFTISEYLTMTYGAMTDEVKLLTALYTGPYAGFYWGMIIIGFIVPAFLLSLPKTRTVRGIIVSAILVNIGMWVKRFVIIVPTLALPQLTLEWGSYLPTWVEIAITAGSFAAFTLLFLVFSKLFPIVSIWEVEEEGSMDSNTVKVAK